MVQEYIDENGGCSRNFFERSDLVAEAARLAQEVERNVSAALRPASHAQTRRYVCVLSGWLRQRLWLCVGVGPC